ncbi:MAG: hypothetical protein K0R54_2870 [Clostridiaceae bacterium]|jgi:hypothetical protein|nr:hypothetical protein [Clostridiaceae bacterium]
MRLKKLTALISGVLVSTMIFSGCSTEGTALYNAFAKTQTINSMETTTTVKLNIAGTNLSDQEKQMMQTLTPMLNDSTIAMTTKTSQNSAKTVAKAQSDVTMQFGGMSMNMGVWVNTDLTGDKPQLNEIVKLPAILTSSLPNELKGKQYMVMDFDSLSNASGASQLDYSKLINFSKDFQTKLADFMTKYSQQYNPDLNIVSNLGNKSITQDGATQSVNVYEVKLTDASFKALLKYTLTNFATNTDAVNLLEEYIKAVSSVGGSSNDAELQKVLDELPALLTNSSTVVDRLQNVKLLGDKGITIDYSVNSDGYIINESLNGEFVIDMPGLNKLAAASGTQDATMQSLTGIYTIGITSNSETNKINQAVTINMPAVNSTNSFNYSDLINAASSQGKVNPGWNNINGKWYYGNSDGSKKVGWLSEGGKWYYLDTNGVMASGWKSEGGSWYYLQSNGAMKVGWQLDGGKWYYLQTSGAMKIGWHSEGGKWYLLQPCGAMKTGWYREGNKYYYLKSNGEMAANTVIGGYRLGSDGAWVQ